MSTRISSRFHAHRRLVLSPVPSVRAPSTAARLFPSFSIVPLRLFVLSSRSLSAHFAFAQLHKRMTQHVAVPTDVYMVHVRERALLVRDRLRAERRGDERGERVRREVESEGRTRYRSERVGDLRSVSDALSPRRRTLITPTSRDWPKASYEAKLKSFLVTFVAMRASAHRGGCWRTLGTRR